MNSAGSHLISVSRACRRIAGALWRRHCCRLHRAVCDRRAGIFRTNLQDALRTATDGVAGNVSAVGQTSRLDRATFADRTDLSLLRALSARRAVGAQLQRLARRLYHWRAEGSGRTGAYSIDY